MTKNIFRTSLLRSRLRTILILLLITLSAFIFFLRAIEFFSVRAGIYAIADTYEPIVFFNTDDLFEDVSDTIPYLQNNEFVKFIDHRVTFEGFLLDLLNVDYLGEWMNTPRADQRTFADAFFYGTLIDKTYDNWEISYRFDVDTVLAGFPEHVTAGQKLTVMAPRTPENLELFETLEIGQRYFSRGLYTRRSGSMGGVMIPVAGRERSNELLLTPINLENLSEEVVYFIPASQDLEIESDPRTSHLLPIFEQMWTHQTRLILNGVTSMENHPYLQGDNPILRLVYGRWITRTDTENQNPVVMISNEFARVRGLEVGDTLRVNIPHEQVYSDIFSTNLSLEGGAVPLGSVSELVVTSDTASEETQIELEIVGVYFYRMFGQYGREHINIYLPNSILPSDLSITGGDLFPDLNENFIPASNLSFILNDSRLEQDFITRYEPVFEEMGFGMGIVSSDSTFFWQVATPTLTILGFNLGLFFVIYVLVSFLVVFLYLRSQLKNISITRAVGSPKSRVYRQYLSAISLITLVGIGLASLCAFIVGRSQVQGIMSSFAEFGRGTLAEIQVSIVLILALIIISYLIIFIINSLFILVVLHLPILELLQGQLVFIKNKKVKHIKQNVFYFKNKNIRYITSQIQRQGMKSAIGFMIPLFFILTLGWISESTKQTQNRIEQIYDETIVEAQIDIAVSMAGLPRPGFSPTMTGFHLEGAISPPIIETLRTNEMVQNLHTESGNVRAFILKPDEVGGLPADWAEQLDFDTGISFAFQLEKINFLYGFEDFERFIQMHSPDEGEGLLENIEITFADGFDASIFTKKQGFCENEPIPIIVFEEVLTQRNINLGDTVIIGYTELSFINTQYRRAVVAGSHNGRIHSLNAATATLIPLPVLEEMYNAMLTYTHASFTIAPEKNREIDLFRETVSPIVERFGHVPLHLLIRDEGLRNNITVATQTLILLELLYPVTLIFCGVILSAITLLIMLQSAKTAALMRIIGKPKAKTIHLLVAEQSVPYLFGLSAGYLLLILLGWGMSILKISLAFGLLGLLVLCGSYLGAGLITKKSPIELLQVRE